MSINEYGMAWLVVLGAGLLTLGLWFLLTRPIPWPWLRTVLRCLVAAWLLLPAPVPNHDGQYAPAFIVALFEAVFQRDGAPEQALKILLAGSLAVLLLLLLGPLTRRFFNRDRAAGA